MVVAGKTIGDRIFNAVTLIFMSIVLFITLFPLWNQLIISVSEPYAGYTTGVLLYPKGFNLDTYKLVLKYPQLWMGFKNSVARVILGTALAIVFTAMTAYPLSKEKLPFNKAVTGFIFFTMLFGGGLIPNYLLIVKLGMLDRIWALVIPTMISAFNVFIMRNFFKTLPASLEESAKIDGAGYFYILWKIIFPLSLPVIATVSLWIAVMHWNSWFDALIYINSKQKIVLQLVLRKIVIENNPNDINGIINLAKKGVSKYTGRQLQATMILVAVIPMLVLYPFMQKYFIRGIMIGAVKG